MIENMDAIEFVREMQKIQETNVKMTNVLEMQKTMDAFIPSNSAINSIIQMNKEMQQIATLRMPNMLSDNHLFWKEQSFWKEQQKWKEQIGLLNTNFGTSELIKGIRTSDLGTNIANLSLGKGAHELFSHASFSSNVIDLLKINEGFRTTLDGSRLANSDLENMRDFYTIDYNFSKIIEVDSEPLKIITPEHLITQAKTIKRIIYDIYKENSTLLKVSPRQFEELIAELLDSKGYKVELTKQTRDGGYDILALTYDNGMPLKYLVECKKYKKDKKVGIDIVRSFSDVINRQQANKGIIFTTSYFTEGVRKRQQENPYFLELKDHEDIITWVQEYMCSI
jgi:HJR/Mrr/RecB family endonuclease